MNEVTSTRETGANPAVEVLRGACDAGDGYSVAATGTSTAPARSSERAFAAGTAAPAGGRYQG